MKAILLSIKPEWLVKILNGEKTIEIRKLFPKDYVGWVYLYCAKNGNKIKDGLVYDEEGKGLVNKNLFPYAKNCPEHNRLINGKVLARFWCDKVEEIDGKTDWLCRSLNQQITFGEICKKACLEEIECYKYLKGNNGYAIHIHKLEIFDRPRELSEFRTWCKDKPMKCEKCKQGITKVCSYRLTKAPQNFCYSEGGKLDEVYNS